MKRKRVGNSLPVTFRMLTIRIHISVDSGYLHNIPLDRINKSVPMSNHPFLYLRPRSETYDSTAI
ncbi:hypothetical protein CISG_03689 [Coccidioides immitis RMSCC 3703]|uniref:Uncharacterized protein n=1 Tax=Coccidioides immitis RMSCC 3703 TaxID=454286 RepID=A0A0J8QML6_COCIT|nr:hypothetical protein CISG_03689 [Coccidioides immitis RMSCC 3703]